MATPDFSLTLAPFVLVRPAIELKTMILSATEVFGNAGITLKVKDPVSISAARYEILNVGQCGQHQLTPEQERLFQWRSGADRRDIAAYFLRATVEASSGCANHPVNVHALVVTSRATKWTLGHEIGHVLGLAHSTDTKNLMWKSTQEITDTPSLSRTQVGVIRNSPLLSEVA